MKRYPEYKDSGIEWLGEIPSAWVKGRLRYYSTAKRGSGYQYLNEVDDDYNGRTEKVVRISDISEFNPILCKYQEQFENYRIEPDNILIGGTGHYFGKSIFVTNEMEGLIHSYNIIRIIIKKQISKYVQYWLSSIKIREQMDISVLGSGQPFIDIEGLKNLEILIPPLSEQTAIANFLDLKTQQINDLIERKKRLIELLKEERTAVINYAVTKGLDANVPMKDSGIEWLGEIPEHWEIWKLSHAFNQIGSGTTPKSDNEAYYNDGNINWLLTGDLNDSILYETSKKITQKALDEHSALKLFPAGSLVIAMYGATIGKLAILQVDATVNQACCVISEGKIVEIKFLYYWLLANRQHIISMSYGGGQPNISQEIVKSLKIQSPSVTEQITIINYLDKKIDIMDKQFELIQKEIAFLNEYKTALINEAVTGKIDVREYHIKEIS